MNENVASLVFDSAKRVPQNGFLAGVHKSYSFFEAQKWILNCAAVLRQKGVEAGDRVVICYPNDPEVVLLMFAVQWVNATAVILYEHTTQFSLDDILAQVEPRLVFLKERTDAGGASLKVTLKKLALSAEVLSINALSSMMSKVSSDDTTCSECVQEPPEKAEDSREVLEENRGALSRSLALIIFTSGSTGKPRGVCLSHENILFVVQKIQDRLHYQSSDVVGLFLPLSFDYGLYQAFLCALSGAQLLVRDASYAGPLLLSCLNQKGITVLPCVPNLLTILLKLTQKRKRVFPYVKVISNTGAHLPESTIAAIPRVFPSAEVYPMYGLTECKRVSILQPHERVLVNANAVGRPLDGTLAWVVDEKGNPLGPGEVGELVVKGPHVAQGYWRAPEETRRRFRMDPRDGQTVLYTGDRFSMDASGFLYYAGRLDNQIKRHGFRMNTLEVELAVLSLKGILNAAIVFENEVLVLFLTVLGADITESDIWEKLSTVLEPHKMPDRIHLLEEMPKTRHGKVNVSVLAEMC